jgi:hypothetical protein
MKLVLPPKMFDDIKDDDRSHLLFGRKVDGLYVAVLAHGAFDNADLRIAKPFLGGDRFLLPVFEYGTGKDVLGGCHARNPAIDLLAVRESRIGVRDDILRWTFFDYIHSASPIGREGEVMRMTTNLLSEEIVADVRAWYEQQYPYRPSRWH